MARASEPNKIIDLTKDENSDTYSLQESSNTGITFEGLDPVLGTLGVMIGLLKKTGSVYELDIDWFLDPYTKSVDGIKANIKEFGQLLGQLLGDIGGNAIGVPEKDPAILGTWYPIQIKNSEGNYEPTGLNIVSIDNEIEGTTEAGDKTTTTSTAIGIGILKKWSNLKDIPVDVDVWASLPIVVIKEDGSFDLTFTDNDNVNPVSIGIAVQGSNANSPIINQEAFQFNGVKFNANLFIKPELKFDVSIEVLAMKLANDDAPKNYSLADLKEISALNILDTAVNLFTGALAEKFPNQADEIKYIAPLFGFSSNVPNNENKLPLMEWVELFQIALKKGNVSEPFFNWFNEISTTPEALQTWMSCFSGVLGIAEADIKINGQGTRTQPYQAPLLKIAGVGQINFNVGTTVIGEGNRFLYPGLSYTSEALEIAADSVCFMMEADLELAQFQLSANDGVKSPVALELNFVANFNLVGANGKPLLDNVQGITIEKLSGGLAIGALTGKIVPHFELINLTLPSQFGSGDLTGERSDDSDDSPNEFGSVNLLSTDDLANVGAVALSGELQRLLLGESGDPSSFRIGIAVLIGLIKPTKAPDTWSTPPFSEKGMLESIKDPINQWAAYYLNVLTATDIDGVRPFTYMLEDFAAMLQVGDAAVIVNGSGTQKSPWSVGLSINDLDLPAYLTAYEITKGTKTELVVGISLAPVLNLAGIKIIPSVDIDAVHIILEKNKPTATTWFHGISAKLALPDKMITPEFGNSTISVDKAELSGGWYQNIGWKWSLLVEKPTLTIGSNNPIVGADLNFSDQDSWMNLVDHSAATFGPFFSGAVGIGMMRTKTRAGFFAAASMGLLTDFSNYPIYKESGLDWKGFSGINLTSFKDPLKVVRDQIASNFSTPEKSKTFLSLLSWVITNQAKAPEILGEGSFLKPFNVPLPAGFNLPVWFDETSSILGLGLAKDLSFNYSLDDEKINVAVSSRLNGFEYNLNQGVIATDKNTPSLFLEVLISNSEGGNLIELPGDIGYLGQLMIGFELSIDGSNLVFEPKITLLNSKLEGQDLASDISLTEYLTDPLKLKAAFVNLLNLGIQKIFDLVKSKDLFKETYELFAGIGLTIPYNFDHPVENIVPGINSSGWEALMANPLVFMEGQMIAYLEKSGAVDNLIKILKTLTGFEFPSVPGPVLDLLSGLGLVGLKENNYPINLKTLLSVITDPVNELEVRFKNLFTNQNKRKKLAKELTQNIPNISFGPFTFSANTNGIVNLRITDDSPINIGSYTNGAGKIEALISLSGGLQLNFSDESASVSFSTHVPILDIALQSLFSVALKDDKVELEVPAISLIFGNDNLPSVPPLNLLPIPNNIDPGNFYLNQFKLLAPAYASNIILNAIFESKLLNEYPLVQHVFEMLGIATLEEGSEKVYKMQSILGLLLHPLDWVLSDEVLGTKGRFDIVKLANKLGQIPKKSYKPNGGLAEISIGPNDAANGMTITGLPYGFGIDISGDTTKDNELARFSFGCKSIDIVDSASVKDLIFTVNVTPSYQAAITGGVKLATTQAGGLFLDFKYDKNLELSFGTGTTEVPIAKVQLLPFIGWGALAGQAGTLAATKIIEEVVPIILNKIDETAPDFATAMRTFGTNVPVQQLIDAIAKIIAKDTAKGADVVGKEIEAEALTWLKELFDKDSGQLAKTTAAIVGIFKLVPANIGTVTSVDGEDGLLKFSPGLNLPIDIFFGVDNNSNIGIWAGLIIPTIPYLNINVLRTGIGVDLATLNNLEFSFGFEIILPVDDQYGPSLKLSKTSKAVGGGDPTAFFNLILDPMAKLPDGETPSQASEMTIELAPILFGVDGKPPTDLGEAASKWMISVLKNVLPRYLSILLLNQKDVRPWLDYNLFETIKGITFQLTAAELLLATTVIVSEQADGEEKSLYVLNTIDNIKKITPLSFLSHLLKELLKEKIEIVKIGENGGITVGPKSNDKDNTYYGINISAPDFIIEAAPNIIMQLGAKNKEWIDQTYPESKLDAGIQFYLPITFDGDIVQAQFDHFNIILGNVGVDIVGKNGQPIVDFTSFKLGAVEPRFLLDLQFNGKDEVGIVFGGNLSLAEMQLSLAPSSLQSGDSGTGKSGNSTNPIASSLLGSGSEGEADKKNETASPGFSIQAAYTYDFINNTGQEWVNLASANGEGKNIMFPIQRAFGPLFIDELGVGWNDKEKSKPILDILFTGDVDLAGLKIDLIGLDIGIPVTTPTDFSAYSIDLKGLDVTYNGGAVTVSGGLLKQDIPLQYSGSAIIKASTFSVMALGSYAQIKDSKGEDVTSMFIFGAIDIPLGGPPAFFINGLAAGFGYNRSIQIPSVEDIMDFPLITGVLNGTLTSGDSPESALAALGDIVAPEVGEYWIAAGLKFKSFELINTAALLFINFGNSFEINILGLSYAALPPESKKENALAYFELALKVSIKPEAGVVSVQAQLTSNSFILSKDCKVTGGFAFFLWYKDTTQLVDGKQVPVPKGQFVVSLGGYHPKFIAPLYYPIIPRLGLQWKMDFSVGSVSITGGTYFAICPTAVMAGGYMDATFKSGPLKAWFNAYANFLIEWKPFYFDVGIGITVGASFGTTIGGVDVTLSVQMGALLELSGPPIGGKVGIDWTVISFTIPFGDKKPDTSPNNLGSWDIFAESFLPAIEATAKKSSSDVLLNENDEPPQQVLKWNSGAGLQNPNIEPETKSDEPWIVDIMFYSFDIASVIPISVFKTQIDESGTYIDINGSGEVGVRPMGFTDSLQAPVFLVIKDHKGTIINLQERSLLPTPTLDGAPSALWSQSILSKDVVPSGDDMIILDTLVGTKICADTYTYNALVNSFDISTLEDSKAPVLLLPFALTPTYPAATTGEQKIQFTQIKKSIMSTNYNNINVVEIRNEIYAALSNVQVIESPKNIETGLQDLIVKTRNQANIDAPQSPDLSIMAQSAELILQVFPIITPIGTYQNKGVPTPWQPYNPIVKAVETKTKVKAKEPQLEGVLRRHISGLNVNNVEGINSVPKINAKWTNRNQIELNKMKSSSRKVMKTADTNQHLYEGGAYMWSVDCNEIHKVKLNGDLSALALCFDSKDNLIAKFLIQVNQEISLIKGTSRVVVVSHNPSDYNSVGWNRDIKVTKINSKWAMTDGCLICIQNAQRVRLVDKSKSTGIILMDRVLSQNKVLDKGDILVEGWIQTTCFSSSNLVGILVNSSAKNALMVSAKANEIPNTLGGAQLVDIEKHGDLFLHLFNVDNTARVEQHYIGILAKGSTENIKIHGVHTIHKRAEESFNSNQTIVTQKAMNLNAEVIKSSQLVLTH